MAMASPSLLLLFSIFLQLTALSFAQESMLTHYCSNTNGNFTANSTYQANLNDVLSSISSNTEINYGFYNASDGQNPDQVNAIALCRGDINPVTCRSCINNSTRQLTSLCPEQKEAIIWYDACMLRYSNRTIFGNMEFRPSFSLYNINNVTEVNQFNRVLGDLLDSLKNQAASGDSLRKFATGNATAPSSQRIYALVQCTPDLSQNECIECLNNATALLPSCCDGRQGGRVVGTSCNFRYEIERFYDLAASAPTPSPMPLPPPPSTSTSRQPPPSQGTTEAPPPPRTSSANQKGNGSKDSRVVMLIVAQFLLLQYLSYV